MAGFDKRERERKRKRERERERERRRRAGSGARWVALWNWRGEPRCKIFGGKVDHDMTNLLGAVGLDALA